MVGLGEASMPDSWAMARLGTVEASTVRGGACDVKASMAAGDGTRRWPESREGTPSQLLTYTLEAEMAAPLTRMTAPPARMSRRQPGGSREHVLFFQLSGEDDQRNRNEEVRV